MSLFNRTKEKKGSGKSSGTMSKIRIDSNYYPIQALDQKSVTASGVDRDFIKGQRIHFSFVIEIEGEKVEVPTHGIVLRMKNNQLTSSFLAPQPYYQRYLRRIASSLPNPATPRR